MVERRGRFGGGRTQQQTEEITAEDIREQPRIPEGRFGRSLAETERLRSRARVLRRVRGEARGEAQRLEQQFFSQQITTEQAREQFQKVDPRVRQFIKTTPKVREERAKRAVEKIKETIAKERQNIRDLRARGVRDDAPIIAEKRQFIERLGTFRDEARSGAFTFSEIRKVASQQAGARASRQELRGQKVQELRKAGVPQRLASRAVSGKLNLTVAQVQNLTPQARKALGVKIQTTTSPQESIPRGAVGSKAGGGFLFGESLATTKDFPEQKRQIFTVPETVAGFRSRKAQEFADLEVKKLEKETERRLKEDPSSFISDKQSLRGVKVTKTEEGRNIEIFSDFFEPDLMRIEKEAEKKGKEEFSKLSRRQKAKLIGGEVGVGLAKLPVAALEFAGGSFESKLTPEKLEGRTTKNIIFGSDIEFKGILGDIQKKEITTTTAISSAAIPSAVIGGSSIKQFKNLRKGGFTKAEATAETIGFLAPIRTKSGTFFPDISESEFKSISGVQKTRGGKQRITFGTEDDGTASFFSRQFIKDTPKGTETIESLTLTQKGIELRPFSTRDVLRFSTSQPTSVSFPAGKVGRVSRVNDKKLRVGFEDVTSSVTATKSKFQVDTLLKRDQLITQISGKRIPKKDLTGAVSKKIPDTDITQFVAGKISQPKVRFTGDGLSRTVKIRKTRIKGIEIDLKPSQDINFLSTGKRTTLKTAPRTPRRATSVSNNLKKQTQIRQQEIAATSAALDKLTKPIKTQSISARTTGVIPRQRKRQETRLQSDIKLSSTQKDIQKISQLPKVAIRSRSKLRADLTPKLRTNLRTNLKTNLNLKLRTDLTPKLRTNFTREITVNTPTVRPPKTPRIRTPIVLPSFKLKPSRRTRKRRARRGGDIALVEGFTARQLNLPAQRLRASDIPAALGRQRLGTGIRLKPFVVPDFDPTPRKRKKRRTRRSKK